MRAALLLPLILMLAACGNAAREECVEAATAEVDRLDALIDETEANLLRGYALERTGERSGGIELCTGGPLTLCASRGQTDETRPSAIDEAAERAKLATLLERRLRQAELAAREVAACERQFAR